MKKTFSLLFLISTGAWANLHLAPPDVRYKETMAIFVDFKTADYDITFNLGTKSTTVKSKITFMATQNGKAIFDLVPTPYNIKLDGLSVKQKSLKLPETKSRVRLIDKIITPGLHTIEMESQLSANVSYLNDFEMVSSAFWIRDLKARMFLEQYLPSNLEFDQYKMTMNITFQGVYEASQDIYTNGKLQKVSLNKWKIEYPDYFTSSCVYFHTTPKGFYPRRDFTYQSIDGRVIPITVYSPLSSRNKKFYYKTLEMMKELEEDYGPWGHDSFIAYGTMPGTGGMEHSGATQTSLAALDHEMLHSYFAKGVMPANGNSGWIDEAIASWRDLGYPRMPDPGFEGSNMGARSVYSRSTDARSYKQGANFMAYLDYKLQNTGGLKSFLRGYFAAYNHTVITTEHFRNNLEFFSGLDLDEEFGVYIWGRGTVNSEFISEPNPYHPELTADQLKKLL